MNNLKSSKSNQIIQLHDLGRVNLGCFLANTCPSRHIFGQQPIRKHTYKYSNFFLKEHYNYSNYSIA